MTEPPRMNEAVLGFRAWDLTANGLAARSRPGVMWKPGVNKAECIAPVVAVHGSHGFPRIHKDDHTSPSPTCGCGLYAWHSLDTLRRVRKTPGEQPLVFGAVAGWGRTFAHHKGWRAENARILALALAPPAPAFYKQLVEAAGRFYGVPVVPLEMLQLEGARHASTMPDEHIPETSACDALAPGVFMTTLQGPRTSHIHMSFVGVKRPRALTLHELCLGVAVSASLPTLTAMLLELPLLPYGLPLALSWGAAVGVYLNRRRWR